MMLWELASPRRQLSQKKPLRWASNLGVVVLDAVILRFLFPAAAMGVALAAQQAHWGLFNNIQLPFIVKFIASVIILDFAIYIQHVMFHAVPLFWRVHRMHHVDLDVDVTTGLRFHPLEIVMSMLIKFGVVILLGAPASAVIAFEVLLNGTSMFNHSNVYLPKRIDRIIRWFIVTPDMHRVHHSILIKETNSNFGFNLSIWDRLFGTYRSQPQEGHQGMTIGITTFRSAKHCINLLGMLAIPFFRKISNYPITRQQ